MGFGIHLIDPRTQVALSPIYPLDRQRNAEGLRRRIGTSETGSANRPADQGELPPLVLSELRLLTMEKFDSICLLTIILAGDSRLTNSFKQTDLIPVGTRIRTRMVMDPWMKPQLLNLLQESTQRAGNPKLLTADLAETLAEYAAGNPRVMMNLAAECLSIGQRKESVQLDAGLFFELFPLQVCKSPLAEKLQAALFAKKSRNHAL